MMSIFLFLFIPNSCNMSHPIDNTVAANTKNFETFGIEEMMNYLESVAADDSGYRGLPLESIKEAINYFDENGSENDK